MAVTALSGPNGLSPDVGTHRDVPLGSGHNPCVSKAVNADAIPLSVPLLPGEMVLAPTFCPVASGAVGRTDWGAERFCVRTTLFFFFNAFK